MSSRTLMIPDQRIAAPYPFHAPRERRETAEAVRNILHAKGLTLYQLAALTRARYPLQTSYHIRRNFYSQLRSGLSPTFQQLLALSQLTGHRLWDWLAVFGFSAGDIPRLQAILSRPRTGLIDKDLVDPQAPVPFLRYRRPGATLPAVAPLSQFLEESGSQPAAYLMEKTRHDFLYARIGTEDAPAFPELAPGSIVRADPRLVQPLSPKAFGERSPHLFLVEHSRGLNCGRLRVTRPHHVAFVTPDRSLANVEFRIGTEARILGVVDFELCFRPAKGRRPGPAAADTAIPSGLRESWKPIAIDTPAGREGPSALLKKARLQAGLSFRSAAKLSREIAKTLGDDRYFASSGTLSDYEAGDKLPRHIHKLFTLSILYSIALPTLLRWFEIVLDDGGRNVIAGKTSVSPRVAERRVRPTNEEPSDSFFESMQKQFGDLPLFIASALPSLCGISHISLRDVFWTGGKANALHPRLRGAVFLLVNHRSKKPRVYSQVPQWSQPLYLLQDRAGSYIAASCAIENGRMVVYIHPRHFVERQPIRRYLDADVVGQIVGISRSLLSPP
jgi:transcriptional regulator with XRE-family HTH domain